MPCAHQWRQIWIATGEVGGLADVRETEVAVLKESLGDFAGDDG
jgi:hypothetical protein